MYADEFVMVYYFYGMEYPFESYGVIFEDARDIGILYKPAWLGQVSEAKRRLRVFQATATTKNENSPKQQSVAGYFRINQHGWTKIFLTSQPQPRMKTARINNTSWVIFG